MSAGALKDRGDALETEFFARQNAKAVEALRVKRAAEESHEALGRALGLSDGAVLDALIEAGIGSETVAALALIPLVVVAWADGTLDDAERDAIERASEEASVDGEHRALLSAWLNAPPDANLLDAWKQYIEALRGQLDADACDALRDRILGGARQVAESAGGFLGLGNKVSASEAGVLDDLEACFKA